MITLSSGLRLHFIGDPHLGRKFETGVPFARRGERERKQLAHFREELEIDADIIVVVGDLFDHPYVGYAVVDIAAAALRGAAERNPSVLYIVIAGNHDLPKNIASVGAYHDLVARLDGRYSNLKLLRRPTTIAGVGFFPWEWDRRADEQVKDLKDDTFEIAVGHWDLSLFDGKDDHLAPVKELPSGMPIYSGHYHRAGVYKVKGVEVVCTGSLEPYAHDQDVTGAMYITLPLSEAVAAKSGTFKDKCLRVILAPGESMPDIDCLALTHIRSEAEATETVTLSTEDFDWNKLLAARIAKLDPAVQTFIEERSSRGASE